MTNTLPSHVQPLETIAGAYLVHVKAFADERGAFMETFRREWFPQVAWDAIQGNTSISKQGVLRGLHYHLHQVDYWFVARGQIRVAMVDIRPSSPTYRNAHTLELSDTNRMGLFIPSGVAHGFYAQTDVMLTYLVNQYYGRGDDENGVAWNDPALGLDWGVEGEALVSSRDVANPLLQNIPVEKLPR